MTDRAAISAQLVDVRNVGHNKSIKLTLHVPAEQAPLVMDAFGWPTSVDPVPVALARINVEAAMEVAPKPPPSPDFPQAGARDPIAKRLNARAALICKDELFHRYVGLCTSGDWIGEEEAAAFMREKCGVESRSQILPGTEAAQRFADLLDDYQLWRDAPKFAEQNAT